MKDKILVWSDVGLVNFGVAVYLQKEFDYEIYSIIDTNKGRNFYENQDLIQFKKIWFYRDCFSHLEEEIDLEYLKKFENKYKIDLWKIVYSDEMLYGYNRFYKFKEKEILKILEIECRFFEKILDEIMPKFLLMRITDTSTMQILYELCIAKGIKPLVIFPSRLGDKFLISENCDSLDSSFDILDNSVDNINNNKIDEKINTFDELKDYIKEFSVAHELLMQKFKTSKIKWVIATFKFLRLSMNKKYKKFFRNKSRNIFNVIRHSISFTIRKKYNGIFMDKKLNYKLEKEEPFIYYALQLEPERTIQIPAPYYTNQLEVIRSIAKSIPIGYQLYVKEHPAQKWNAWRPISFYKEILKMPNVKMYHPSISNDDMIKNCKLVVTITGTAGLEAVLNQKPAIILANTTYSQIPSVYYLKNLSELHACIKKMLKIKPELKEITDYLKMIEPEIFDYKEYELGMKVCNYFFYDGFLFDNEISMSKMKLFLEENKIIFKKLAFQHDKKFKKMNSISTKN